MLFVDTNSQLVCALFYFVYSIALCILVIIYFCCCFLGLHRGRFFSVFAVVEENVYKKRIEHLAVQSLFSVFLHFTR